jgi:malonyl-CoA O-methyltransferase
MTYKDAIDWLKKAFSVTCHDGISAYYDERIPLWQAPYPEVSGYCIPTLIKAGEEDIALRISRWLRKQQMSDGSIPMGFHNSYIPFVFDTGQVLRGWQAAQQLDYSDSTQESIDRAVRWLKRSWNETRWVMEGTQKYETPINMRVVWPLKLYEPELADEITEHYLTLIEPNGFPNFADEQQPDNPLTHFLVYTARGFWECDVPAVAEKIMTQLGETQTLSFPARVDRDFQPTTDEVCNVAVAQAAVLWDKMGRVHRADKARAYLFKLDAPWASTPKDSDYFPGCQIAWCAKFIADALCNY